MRDIPSVRKSNFEGLAPKLFLTLAGLSLALILTETFLGTGLVRNRLYDAHQPYGETKHPAARILILGDSFINDWKSPECLFRRLLKDFEPYRFEVLNAAGGGMGPDNYWEQMKTYAPRFRPQLVLVSYYVGNDLTNIQYRTPSRSPLKRFLKPIFLKFYLYHYVLEVWERTHLRTLDPAQARRSGISDETLRLVEKQKINPGLVEMGIQRNNYVLDNLLLETPENQAAWKRVEAYLESIRELSQRLDAHLLIVIFPHTAQVNASHFDFYESLKIRMDPRTLADEAPQKLLKSFCETKGLVCLDLLPHFRAQAQREFFLAADDHLNPDGNAFAEERIFRSIRENFRARGLI